MDRTFSTLRKRVAPVVIAALTVVSCHGDPSTQPGASSSLALPGDSLPHFSIGLPAGRASTTGITETISLVAVNVAPQSCVVSGPSWLGLAHGSDANVAWTVTPTDDGLAPIRASCKDYRGATLAVDDTLTVYPMPDVTPSLSGFVAVQLNDSLDVSYDSTATSRVTVSCAACTTYASMVRLGRNTIRLYARRFTPDSARKTVCFAAAGLDGRTMDTECLAVVLKPAAKVLLSIPDAVRKSEAVPLHDIPVATYDNTGESNHPDVMRFATPFAGRSCWMVFTPYAHSNGQVENPSLAVSKDCEHWRPAPGVPAPLIPQKLDAYNSDPELVFDDLHRCLGVLYREVQSTNAIKLSSSCNGVAWSEPRVLFAEPNHRAVSPTVADGPDGRKRIWYVDAGATGCSTNTTVIRMRTEGSDTTGLASMAFGPAEAVNIDQPGYVIWHIKVRYIPEKLQYWAMYAAFPRTTGNGNCTDDDLFFATSPDGRNWRTYPVPLVNELDARFDFATLYRGTFLYDAAQDRLVTILSAIEGGQWGQFGVSHSYPALISALNMTWTSRAALLPSPGLLRAPGTKRKPVRAGEDYQ